MSGYYCRMNHQIQWFEAAAVTVCVGHLSGLRWAAMAQAPCGAVGAVGHPSPHAAAGPPHGSLGGPARAFLQCGHHRALGLFTQQLWALRTIRGCVTWTVLGAPWHPSTVP